MDRHLIRNLIISIFLISLLIPTLLFADEYYDAAGFNPNRETFSMVPYEHIDTFTGGVTLSFIDGRLPGNGGLDLVIQRTFNSKIWRNVGTLIQKIAYIIYDKVYFLRFKNLSMSFK